MDANNPFLKLYQAVIGKPVYDYGDYILTYCPFHDDRTPSFAIYKDHVHCYGCGFHTNRAFTFAKALAGGRSAAMQLLTQLGIPVRFNMHDHSKKRLQALEKGIVYETHGGIFLIRDYPNSPIRLAGYRRVAIIGSDTAAYYTMWRDVKCASDKPFGYVVGPKIPVQTPVVAVRTLEDVLYYIASFNLYPGACCPGEKGNTIPLIDCLAVIDSGIIAKILKPRQLAVVALLFRQLAPAKARDLYARAIIKSRTSRKAPNSG